MSEGTYQMWAYALSAPGSVEPCEAQTPGVEHLEPGQVLLRVLAGAICGSDLAFFRGKGLWSEPLGGAAASDEQSGRWHMRPGFPLHEVVGEVVASKHPSLDVGLRCVGWAAMNNGMAEYVVTDGDWLIAHNAPILPEIAVMLQPLACVLYAVESIGAVDGKRVAILGQGPIGLLFSHVVKSYGARAVIGIDKVDRADVAASFGVDEAIRSSTDTWAWRIGDQDRPEIVVEAIGHQVSTLEDAVEAVGAGGLIYYFGVPDDSHYPAPIGKFFRKNLSLRSGVTRQHATYLSRAIHYLDAHPRLKETFVTDVYSIDQAQTAFDLANTPSVGHIKTAMRFS